MTGDTTMSFALLIALVTIACTVYNTLTGKKSQSPNSVEKFTDDHFEGSAGEDGGSFSFSFPDKISSESQLLMKSLILGLENIRDEYGAEYIKFRFREV